MSRRGDMTQLSERTRGGHKGDPAQLRARGASPAAKPALPASRAAPASPATPASPAAPGGAPSAASPPAGDVALGLWDSLASTDEGLRRFLEMMRTSGLAEAVHGYRAMQMVLVQQRLWAHAHQRTELLPLFQSLARTADELHRIFAGFAGVMLPLKELDSLTTMAGLEPDPPAAKAVDAPAEAAGGEPPREADAPVAAP